jgi:hypothetical protein
MLAGLVLLLPIMFLHVRLIGVFDLAALFTVIFFNFLFVFLLFPLKGPLPHKAALLIAGNGVGGLWYLIRLSCEATICFSNIESLRILFTVAKPLIDFVWIVVVWSVSLSVLSRHKGKMEK